MAFSLVGAQHGLGTYSGFIRWTCSKTEREREPLEVIHGLSLIQLMWSLSTHQGLNNRMVGGIHVCIEWEGTFSITVIGSIALRCNDPVLVKKAKEAIKDQLSFHHLCSQQPGERSTHGNLGVWGREAWFDQVLIQMAKLRGGLVGLNPEPLLLS